MSSRPSLDDTLGPILNTPGAFPVTPGDSTSLISSHLTQAQTLRARKSEYTKSRKLKLKIGTWNVASLHGTEKDLGEWFVSGKGVSAPVPGTEDRSYDNSRSSGDHIVEGVGSQESRRTTKESTIPSNDPGSLPAGSEIDIYVLGLQEIVDINSATESLRPYVNPHPARKWKESVKHNLPPGYQKVADQQLLGLYLVIYASPSTLPTISSVNATSVGTGLMGYLGNKGAVAIRIVLGDTTRVVFVNSHLSSGAEKANLERRTWDASQILSRTKFEPVDHDMDSEGEGVEEVIGDEDFAFWFGDLNYRIDGLPGEDIRRLLMLHTRNEYKIGDASRGKIEAQLSRPRSPVVVKDNRDFGQQPSEGSEAGVPSTHTISTSSDHPLTSTILLQDNEPLLDPASDPTSVQTTVSSLLVHDQLHQQMRSRKAFHDGWREGLIDFLPTYKYDVGSVGVFDSSEKQRAPSWCDRILYRTRKDRQAYVQKLHEEAMARKKDDELKAKGLDEAADDEAVLFDYDPETDGADEDYDPNVEENTDVNNLIHKSDADDILHLEHYTSHQRVLSSDHKPLTAVFTMIYDAVDRELKTKVSQEVARELDKVENEDRPVVAIVLDDHQEDNDNGKRRVRSSTFDGVDFGEIRFDVPKIRNVTIGNTGSVPAQLNFADRSARPGQSSGSAPPWLHILFHQSSDTENRLYSASDGCTIEPGDTVYIELRLHVIDIEQTRRFNKDMDKLEDILVLRVHNGRDYFLSVHGTWQQSVFGRSLFDLIQLPEGGIRRWQQQKHEGRFHGHSTVNSSAPKELFRLTEAMEDLLEKAVADWEMRSDNHHALWERKGWPFAECIADAAELDALKRSVREALDTDQGVEKALPPESSPLAKLEAIAATLLAFLVSLEDGVITEALWSDLENGIIERERAKKPLSKEEEHTWVLDVLSSNPPHNIAFTFVTFMLSRVVAEIAPLGPDPPGREIARHRRKHLQSEFASIFAGVLMRLPGNLKAKEQKASDKRARHIIGLFLVPTE